MRNVKLAFVVFVLALLALPWFPLPEMRIHGSERPAPLEPPALKAMWTGKFQKAFEKWWTRHFGSRSTLLVLKNTIYDALNGGMFHAGYSGNVLQGRDGVLFEKTYVHLLFSPANTPAMRATIKDNVAALAALRDALARLDVPLVLIMAPSKAEVRKDALPPIWRFLAAHREMPDPLALYTLYAQSCEAHGILYVNSPFVLRRAGLLRDAFPDQGTHWSMYAAGLAWRNATHLLHSQRLEHFPVADLRAPGLTTATLFQERDIANLLNVYPRYARGRLKYAVAEYGPLPPGQPPLAGLSLGDSFAWQLSANIALSHYAHNPRLLPHSNELPDIRSFFHAITRADFFILTYTEINLRTQRMYDEVQKLLQSLSSVLPVDWHEPTRQGQWSQDTSSLHFLNIHNGSVQFSLTIKNAQPTVTACTVSVNGRKLTKLDVRKDALPRRVTLNIPKEYMKKGENSIALDVEGAAVPARLSHTSRELRLFGILCTDFAIAAEDR